MAHNDDSTRTYGWGPPAYTRPLHAAHWAYRWLPALDDDLPWKVKDHNYQMIFDELMRYPSSREFTEVAQTFIASSWAPSSNFPGLFCKKDLPTAITGTYPMADWTSQFSASDVRKHFDGKMKKYRKDRKLFIALGQRLIRLIMLQCGGELSMEERVTLAVLMREEMGFPTRVPDDKDAEGNVTRVVYDFGLKQGEELANYLVQFSPALDNVEYSDVEAESEHEY